jgi:hypothetical protein
MNVDKLLKADRADLRTLMDTGYSVDAAALENYTYYGISLGLPRWVERLSWQKFMKTFYRDPETHKLRGWNVRTMDDGMDSPWVAKEKNGHPIVFGHYDVLTSQEAPLPGGLAQGLLIDYSRGGQGGNGVLNALRDPLVCLKAGCHKQLLGRSYVAIGGRYIPTPSFFLLIRGTPLNELAIHHM